MQHALHFIFVEECIHVHAHRHAYAAVERDEGTTHPVAGVPCEEHELDHRVHENHVLESEGSQH